MNFDWTGAFTLFIIALDVVTFFGALCAVTDGKYMAGIVLMIVFLVSVFITGGVLP